MQEQEAEAAPMDMLDGQAPGPSAPQEPPAAQLGGVSLPSVATASQDADDEELLALAMEDDQPRASQPQPPCSSAQHLVTASQVVDDEELLALAMEDDQPLQPAPEQQEQQAGLSQTADDEELLAIAMDDDPSQALQPAQPAAPAAPAPAPTQQQQDSEEQLALAMEGDLAVAPAPDQAQAPAAKGGPARPSLGRLARLQQPAAVHDADDEELFALCETAEGGAAPVQQALQWPASHKSAAQHDVEEPLAPCETSSKTSALLQQSSRLQAAAEPERSRDEDEDDAEPMVFTRVKRPAEAVAP